MYTWRELGHEEKGLIRGERRKGGRRDGPRLGYQGRDGFREGDGQ